jgi:SM-20-related protein
LYHALRAEVLAANAEDDLATLPGSAGRPTIQLDRTIRKSRIAWMDGSTPAQAGFLQWAEQLRQVPQLQALMIGLFEFEACFAVYRPGEFYDRHLDSFRRRPQPGRLTRRLPQ